jgi:hypothetical protein
MRRIRIRSLSLAALALLAFAGRAPAQNKSPALLNALEVRQLVAHGEPGDHARLTAHFSALAERYTAEAKLHTSMAQNSVGNPSRSLATGSLRAHCTRLGELNAQSATALHELAAYHQKLASGVAATPPTAGARFEGGAGAPAPTDQEINTLAAKASTPADHRVLEEYFVTLAKRYTSEAVDHAAMANAYRGLPRNPGWAAAAAAHCDRLATRSRASAIEATGAAAIHKQLAGVAR